MKTPDALGEPESLPIPLPGIAGPTVSVRAVRKTYPGGREALRGITFDVGEAEIFGLLGPNGAGKTTTFGILTTTIAPSGGRAFVSGHDVVASPLGVRRAIGVVFQDSVLDNDFTGRENLWLHARLWRLPRWTAERRMDELLVLMDLEDRIDENVRTYSGGMRRRLEIARALLPQPSVIFLDEPTVGLDPAVRDEIWALVERLRRDAAVTVVLSTHYLEEAERICDHVAIMHQGEIVAIGGPEQLVAELGSEIVELRVDGNASAVAHDLARRVGARRDPLVQRDVVSIPVPAGTNELVARVAAAQSDGVSIRGSTVRAASLADVFAHRTGRTLVEVGG